MRADAQRNRQELLSAARALFIERGPDVALEAVAQRAGVSIATLYRNFPDRSALVRCLLMDGLRLTRDAAQQALHGFADDPETAWRSFVQRTAALKAGVLMSALYPQLPNLDADTELAQLRTDAIRTVDRLVAVAQQHGQVRSDISPMEIMLLIMTISRPLPMLPHEHVPAFVERALHVALAGLRPEDDTPLPGQPVSLDG